MAASQPFLTQRQQLGIKIESVEGTGETLSSSDVIMPVYEPDWSPEITMGERASVSTSFSAFSKIAGEKSATISFATEVKGSGTAGTVPPNLSAALRACGMSETIVPATSVTYAPSSASVPTVTIELREGRQDSTVKIKRITGARGTVSFEAAKGNIIMAKFSFTGVYTAPTEGAFLTPPAIGPNPPVFLNASFAFHGVALRIQSCNLDLGNSVSLRNDANQATGNLSAVIVDRVCTGSINPEQELIATADFYAKIAGNTEGTLTFTASNGSGNIVTISAPKAQIAAIAEGDRDGIRTEELTLQMNGSAAAGDDELTIAFT